MWRRRRRRGSGRGMGMGEGWDGSNLHESDNRANKNDGSQPSPFSRPCALPGLILWTLAAFGALVEAKCLIPTFKNFDAKMPAPTEFLLNHHWELGATCTLVVAAIWVRECLMMKGKKSWDVLLLFLGLLVCIFVQGSFWLPFLADGTSRMGGGQQSLPTQGSIRAKPVNAYIRPAFSAHHLDAGPFVRFKKGFWQSAHALAPSV